MNLLRELWWALRALFDEGPTAIMPRYRPNPDDDACKWCGHPRSWIYPVPQYFDVKHGYFSGCARCYEVWLLVQDAKRAGFELLYSNWQ